MKILFVVLVVASGVLASAQTAPVTKHNLYAVVLDNKNREVPVPVKLTSENTRVEVSVNGKTMDLPICGYSQVDTQLALHICPPDKQNLYWVEKEMTKSNDKLVKKGVTSIENDGRVKFGACYNGLIKASVSCSSNPY